MAGSGDFLARIKLFLEGKDQVVQGLQQVQQSAQQLSKTKVTPIFDKTGLVTGKQIEDTFTKIGDKTKQTTGATNDFTKALSRVIVVAPIWMAFRTIIQQVTSTISEGFKTWIEFDNQLAKSKAVIHGYSGSTKEAMGVLEESIRSFSTSSGIALADLTSAFYRFGTVGIAFSDALSGAIASGKLAKVTFADIDTIARSMAMAYRLLGDTIDSTLSPMEKQESLAGKIYHLWKTNAFEANEFSASLNAFVSTANIANFTADQTVATLAALGTAGVMGARGGTLLKTSIQKLVENLDKLAPKLGLAVNPELENTFSLFMRVLGSINELSKTKGIPTEALKSIQEIFGGVRGGQVISALNALFPELKKNLDDLGKDPAKFTAELNQGMLEVSDTISDQIKIFTRLKEQSGEAFVQGVLGGKDYKETLKLLNEILKNELIPGFSVLGETIKNTALALGTFGVGNVLDAIYANTKKTADAQGELYSQITMAYKGQLQYGQVLSLISNLEKNYTDKSLIGRQRIIEFLKTEGLTLIDNKNKQEALTKADQEQLTKVQEMADKTKQLSIVLRDKLDTAKNELDINKLQKAGTDDLKLANLKLDGIVHTMVKRYNSLDLKTVGLDPIDEMSVKTAILAGDFQKVLNIFEGMIVDEKEINSLADAYVTISKEIVQQSDELITHELELLKLRGAGTEEILNAEKALKAQLYGEEVINNSLAYRLKTEKQIAQTKIDQFTISDRNLKLLDIAKKEGVSVAKMVAEALSGTRDFNRSWLEDVMHKYFPKETEAFNANLELKRLGISTETMAAQTVRPLAELQKLTGVPTPTQVQPITTKIDNINISITKPEGKEKEALVNQIQIDIADAIRTNPDVKKALNEQIENF